MDVPRDYFSVHFGILKCIGIPLKPMKDTNVVLKSLYCIYSTLLLGVFPIYFSLSEFLHLFHGSSIDTITFNLSYAITHCLGAIKIILFTAKRRKIYNLCKEFEVDEMRANFERGGEKEYTIIKDAIRLVNNQAYIFNVIVILVLSNRLIALLTGNLEKGAEIILDPSSNTTGKLVRPTPFYGYFPFDYQRTPLYEIVCAYQLGNAWLYGLYLGCTDTILTGFMIHIKAQLLILKNSLSTCVQKAEERHCERVGLEGRPPRGDLQKISEEVQKHASDVIRECVKHHQKIFELSARVESEFNILILMQVLSSVGMTCFQLFQLSMSEPKSFRFASMVFYTILMSFQLVTYCWNGNEAIVHSVDVADAVFGCDWLITDEPTKRTLLLMMLRAQRPVKFTAAKFSVLSLQTYVWILKASGTYFMFLRQINR